MKLLHIDSGILGDNSVTRRLSATIVAAQRTLSPAIELTYRDLAADPLPHLTGAALAAQGADRAELSVAMQTELAASAAALDEFLAADVIVIGAPMYNFSVPSQLKAWIDRVAVAGKTFRYTEKGPVGLAGGKRLIIASSRGGFYEGTANAAVDHQESYLRAVFGFLGITEIEFVRAEGVAMGPEHRAKAIEIAEQAIATLEAA